MEVFSTTGLSKNASREYWNDVICQKFTELDTEFAGNEIFHGKISSAQIGALSFSKVSASRSNVYHTKKHIAKTKERVYLLHLQLKEQSFNSQFGKGSLLEEGDFTLVDSTMPYSVKFNNEISMGVLKIPHHCFEQRMRIPKEIFGSKFSGDKGISGMLSQMLRGYWRQEIHQTTQTISAQLAENILDVLVTSIQSNIRGSFHRAPIRTVRYLQIKRYTSHSLRDPDLSPQKIARIFKITPRYLHQIFAASGNESIGQYILRRRLEECERQFMDPVMVESTITDIAFTWGFNSMTHFSRVFRDKYQLSPREFRRFALG
ncbi:MAG: helix-turn-helix domain-containing protein [Robiginitomaculum sp.]|nr:helix-turn-helix domain-containing protein [Robiginitomaculum sp.]